MQPTRTVTRWRLLAIALTALLGFGVITVAPPQASAVIGDRPLVTWNIRGATTDDLSVWNSHISQFLVGVTNSPIIALQEVGGREPANTEGTATNYLNGAHLLPVAMQGQLPPINIQGGPRQVRHSQWTAGHGFFDVYFLQTDTNADTWGGGRVNLAMVTDRPADDVVIVPNPLGPQTGFAARAALGLRFGTTWYFNIHALSGGGNDAPGLLANIDQFVQTQGANHEWIAMGDFNRQPNSMNNGALPAGAAIYGSGRATRPASLNELDWFVYSGGVHPGVQVNVLDQRTAGVSDHLPVLAGQLRAGAEPQDLYSTDRALESMAAGGVLDVTRANTSTGTPIISSRRNGGANQSWEVEQYNDGTVRFVGRQSGMCMQSAGSGGQTIQPCTNNRNQRFWREYLGNSEYQLRSAENLDDCLNVRGGQSNPSNDTAVIMYPCQNTPNSRWVFTPANANSNVSKSPEKLSAGVPGPFTLESVRNGGVVDAEKDKTGNGTALISFHRTGGANQGWVPQWHDHGTYDTVSFKGVSSGRCVDIHNSNENVGPGRDLVLFDCTGQDSQLWQPEQLDDGQVLLHSVPHPELCMDIERGPANPDDGRMIVWNCSAAANQQWMFTPYDPTGAPVPPYEEPDHDELITLPDPGQPAERTAYFPSWSIYANELYTKSLDGRGIAGKLTTMVYAFENIDPVNLTCFAANKAGSSDESDTTGNDGASDAWADYQRGFTSDISVDGVADQWDQPLKGNFNQLRKLKAKYPALKILLSIGGWTYSKHFSDAAATDASRKKFVSSCIDMYIKGNLPKIGDDPAGGTGVAAGIFDGFDIDWEFPASANGHAGNHTSPQDTANFTLLLKEFRSQLDALGKGHMRLTAALPAGPGDIDKLQVDQLGQVLDMANVMTYDMHGAWETTGPTNFQAPLYDSAESPAARTGLTVNDAVNNYLMRGFPNEKIALGVPLYGRGWTGVPDNGKHGLYQSVTGPTAPFAFSQQPGVAMYKELQAAGKLGSLFYDQQTGGSWVYDGQNFYSIEQPRSLTAKRQYIKNKRLGGIMMYSLEADDLASTLLNAATGFTS